MKVYEEFHHPLNEKQTSNIIHTSTNEKWSMDRKSKTSVPIGWRRSE